MAKLHAEIQFDDVGKGELKITSEEHLLMPSDIRKFDTGATRDTDEGKYDYEAFLSPAVLERYAQYMHKNRIQTDGGLRAGDNWQNLFGPDHKSICMKSAWRHFMGWWKYHRGTDSPWADDINMEESLCAVIFNASAYLFALLEKKSE